ncbi:MAG TPA: helix-turn-helix domain-containing protein [Miltoncostaeaceae bacterium]|nr:helix-turn-helix domain-containing protein [Miltoncostaeaceae bacterium]
MTTARRGGGVGALAPARHTRAAALGRPAARRVAAVLERADGPMTAQEVADALDLHHSGVRGHLAALERAGVLESRTDPPRGRGRPVRRYAWAADPDEREAEGHRELVRLLMTLVGRLDLRPDEMERFGESQGETVPRPGGGMQELWRAFARMGFAPRRPGGESLDLILDRCPFADGVEAPGGELICLLHRGLARGILTRAAPGVTVEGLTVQDPRRAGCRLRIADVRRSR